MKSIFSVLIFLSLSLVGWSQCNLVATAMPSPVSCYGVCDGTIIYFYQNMGAPAPPYIVSLSDSDGNIVDVQTFMGEITTVPYSGLCADTYTILVQGTSCSFTTSATVTSPTEVVVYANTTNPDPGMNNGEVELIVSGGTGPYIFSIDGGVTNQASNIFTGLAPGNYPGIVTDANGCYGTIGVSILLTGGCIMVVTANPISNVTCYGACNGSIQYFYNDMNGNDPYLIELKQGGITLQTATNTSANGGGTFTNLCAGSYTVQVTDITGCTGSYAVNITQPAQLLISGISTTDATAGNNDGTAAITATGGTPTYTYSLDGITYQASNSFTGLAAGVHIGYVKDNAGCISIYTFVIQQDPGCFFNLSASAGGQPSCAWSCDGEIDYIFAGTLNDPPFVIQLQSSGTVIQSTTSLNQTVAGTFSGLCPGNYTVIVTNSGGCQETFNLTMTQPASLYANYSQVNPTIGNSDGSITVNVFGGTAPFQYSMDNGTTWQVSNVFSGLGAGFYIINIMDANGCSTIVCIILTETDACNFVVTALATPASCAGMCDGTVQWAFNDVGNNPPYTIELQQGTTVIDTATVTAGNSGSGMFDGLCEGTYVVEVTNADGCVDSYTVYVDEPDFLMVNGANVTDATVGNSDGSAQLLVSGGTAPYQFSIDNGVTWTSSNTLSGLAAGFYITFVEDANGCTFVFCFVVNEDPGCFINSTLFADDMISCNGACDGSLNFVYVESVNSSPYTIDLTLGGVIVATQTQASNNFTGTFAGLCAGTYGLVVTNANGCSGFIPNATLTQPATIALTASVTAASTGSSNGAATIIATGGTGQLNYSLDNGATWQTSNVFNGLAAGIHIVLVEDENGCMAILNFVITSNSNCNIVLTVFPASGISCSGYCDGELNFAYDDQNAANGPYIVTIANSSGATIGQATFAGDGGSGSFGNLCQGVYTVTVQDANGCAAVQTYIMTSPAYMNVAAVTVDATAGNTDGYATMNIAGGTPPYQLSIDNQVTWQTSNVLNGLGAGVYIVYVKDANGCATIFCFVLGDSNVLTAVESTNDTAVYPNPTQGQVFIASQNVQNVKVYDVSGQLIKASIITASNGVAVDLSGYADGIYMLHITAISGEVNRVQVVKQ